MMTEEEARKKACPFGKIRSSYDGNWDDGRCIASACMAWRFNQMNGRFMQKNGLWYEGGPGPESVGFCGLAGMPGT